MWGFFEPALEPKERRWAVPFVVLATFFFLSGVVFCYVLCPQCFRYFFEFNKGMGVQPELTLAPYLYFLMRFLLAVGVSFELPLVLMIAAVAGFVNSAGMGQVLAPGDGGHLRHRGDHHPDNRPDNLHPRRHPDGGPLPAQHRPGEARREEGQA